jgi:hypothetical protein
LTAELLYKKPDDPKGHIVEYLETVKATGVVPIIGEQDLDTMFAMFDITKRGVVSAQQANAALKTILGPQADLSSVGVNPSKLLGKGEFISVMTKAMKQVMPDAGVKL